MHKIDLSTGGAFVSYMKKPWHNVGIITDEVMTFPRALELGKLQYVVEKLPNIHRIGDIETVSDNSFFTYRTDTNQVLGDKLGKNYCTVQNEIALSIVEDLVEEGGIIETAGALYDGARSFICVRLPKDIMVGGIDRVQQYAVVAAGHDGSLGIVTYLTNIRVVCNNTLQASMKKAKKFTVRHTETAEKRTQEARKILKISYETGEEMADIYTKMVETKMWKSDFMDYVGGVILSEKEISDIINGVPARNVVSTRKQNIIQDITGYYEKGVGQKEIVGTMWGAYNAITGYYSNVKKYKDAESRMDTLVFDNQVLETALELAVKPGGIRQLRNIRSSEN